MNYKDQIYGCAFGCPLQTRDQNCPFNKIDHLSIKEKVIWINALCVEERESIIKHHLICTREKETRVNSNRF